MKISSIDFTMPFNNTRLEANPKTNRFVGREPKSELPKIPAEYLKARIIRKPKYSYRPIASVKPNFEPVGHYDDLDKFTELYTQKINSQLMIPTEKDIENLIERIKTKTNAPENQIREVVYTLGMFSNYNSIKSFDKLINTKNIKSFGLPYQYFDNDTSDFSSNSAVNYLIKNKHFTEFSNSADRPDKICYILDDTSLSQLEIYKNSNDTQERNIYNKFIEDLKNDKYAFVVIKGWDIKTKDNGYKGANMFSGSGYLEDLAVEVIKRIQEGEDTNKIYYSDFQERLYNLVDDKEAKSHISITQLYNEPKEANNQEILDILSPNSVSKDYVKTVLEAYLTVKNTEHKDDSIQTALLKYLDEMTIAYSIDSLSCALKKMGKNIESILRTQMYSKDDTIYIIPVCNKSYSLITHMYSKLNDIDSKNIKSTFNITKENTNKAKVILDDLSASGTSEGKNCVDIRVNYKIGKSPIIYAPVALCNHVEDYESRPNVTQPNAYCFDKYIFDMSKTSKMCASISSNYMKLNTGSLDEELRTRIKNNYKLLDYKDCMILTDLLFHGYDNNALCIVFPYMIPDNGSDISGLILKNALSVANNATNKPLAILYSHRNNDNCKHNYKDILEIIRLIDRRYLYQK